MRISSWLKDIGYEIEYIRGEKIPERVDDPNDIFVTSMFTWTWKAVWKSVQFYKALFPDAKVYLGGVYASIAPEHAAQSGADEVVTGLMYPAENYSLDHSLVDTVYSHIWTSRGCPRNCGFCVVKYVDGSKLTHIKNTIKAEIDDSKSKIMIYDNNFLMNPNRLQILDELAESGKEIYLQAGVDARLINETVFKKLVACRLPNMAVAWDQPSQEKPFRRVCDMRDKFAPKRQIGVYMLYNWRDTPEEIYRRIKTILTRKRTYIFAMKYRPFTFEEHSYISPTWTAIQLRGLKEIINANCVHSHLYSMPQYEVEKIFGKTESDFMRMIDVAGVEWFESRNLEIPT
jgi:hypothetical protein